MNIKLLVKKMDELVDSSDINIINDIDNISLNCISDQKNTLSIMEYDKNIICPKNSNILFLKAKCSDKAEDLQNRQRFSRQKANKNYPTAFRQIYSFAHLNY